MYSMQRTDPRPCWYCTSFGGMVYQGSAARCLQGQLVSIRAMPADGFAFLGREVGTDDEPGPPAVATFEPCPTLQPAPWSPTLSA